MLFFEKEVDRSVHVVEPVPRMRHSVTGPAVWAGSSSSNDAMRPDPACEIGNVMPPIVTLPVRAPPPLAAAVIVTVPLPLPEAGDTVRNDDDESAAAVQVQ